MLYTLREVRLKVSHCSQRGLDMGHMKRDTVADGQGTSGSDSVLDLTTVDRLGSKSLQAFVVKPLVWSFGGIHVYKHPPKLKSRCV